MKLKHTQSKKGRRASSFRKAGNSTAQSKLRAFNREHLHRKVSKAFGYRVIRLQRIFYKEDQFGNKCYKLIEHAKMEA